MWSKPLEFRCRQQFKRSAIRATCVSGMTTTILIPGWTRLDFSMLWHCEQQRWIRRSRKLMRQPFIRFYRWNMLLYSSVTKYITFLTKIFIYPPSFPVSPSNNRWNYIRNCNVNPCTLNMVLGMCQSASENSIGPVSFLEKRRGLQLLHPPPGCSKVNKSSNLRGISS